MTIDHHTQQPPPIRWGRILVALAAASLTIAGCGSDPQQAEPDTSDRISPWVPPAPEDDANQVDVEYGASLAQWAEAADQGSKSATDPEAEPRVVNDYPDGYEEIDWETLLPPGYSSEAIFDRYAKQLNELEDGSPEADVIYAEMQAEFDATSGEINSELDGTKVNLAGFIAPLTNEDDIITEFLLVPYFGACIHVPAPPPNQTVLVKVDKANGISFDDSWGPIWVAGVLTIEPATTDLATVSHTMTDPVTGIYDEYG